MLKMCFNKKKEVLILNNSLVLQILKCFLDYYIFKTKEYNVEGCL